MEAGRHRIGGLRPSCLASCNFLAIVSLAPSQISSLNLGPILPLGWIVILRDAD